MISYINTNLHIVREQLHLVLEQLPIVLDNHFRGAPARPKITATMCHVLFE